MTDDKNIIKSPPFVPYIILLALGLLLSCWLVYIIYCADISTKDTNSLLTIWLKYGAIALFVLLGLVSGIFLLLLKSIELTKDTLIIKRPLLFHSKNYLLVVIKNIRTKEANISYQMDGSLNTINWYKGENLIIKLKDNNTIKIGSLEVSNYDLLKKKLCSLKPS